MSPQTSRSQYRDHKYSGGWKSRKKVRAALKHAHGDGVSRADVYRKKSAQKAEDIISSTMTDQNQPKLKTYERPVPMFRKEAAVPAVHSVEATPAASNAYKLKTYERPVPMFRKEAAVPEVRSVEATPAASNAYKLKTYERPVPMFRKEAAVPEVRSVEATPAASNAYKIAEPLDINWPMPDPTLEAHELVYEKAPNADLSGLSGNRIVDIRHVLHWAFDIERHRLRCTGSVIAFDSEERDGFQSTFKFKCVMCGKSFTHENTKDGLETNTAYVWATVTSGSYYSQASHITNIMNVPTMSASKFRKIETSLGKIWTDHMTEEILKAGQEEKRIAIEKGHITSDGIPYITVYVDGGWAKRTYGHNFNSLSGMACIIGKESKKCLYLGVRNKFCYHCQYSKKQNMTPQEHQCFLNYIGPSTAMESSILVEGFQKSMEMHGVQYRVFIGDGDSSVFAQLKEKVPYGQHIKKLECKNHVIKNYTSALYKILANTKLPLYGRNLLKPRLGKLTAVSRKIIIHNVNNPTVMRIDLQNGPKHVFGQHELCQPYYCKFKTSDHEVEEDMVNLIQDRAPSVWTLISSANESVMAKANRLSNETTNIAENLMSLVSKYNCGKRLNLCKGGSYQRRVQVAGLSHTTGYGWHNTAWRKCMGKVPGFTFQKYILSKQNALARRKTQLRKRLYAVNRTQNQQVDKDYGPNATDPVDDMPMADLTALCNSKLQDFQKNVTEIKKIEQNTIGQHDNELYTHYRKDRLTASNFGMICKRRKTTPCDNHVKTILYKNIFLTNDMAYGQHNESVARLMFANATQKQVRLAGLFIDEEHGFLGASPDGVIEAENAIVEIKCFPSLARNNMDMTTAAREKSCFPLILVDSELKLNKKHAYYYQVQGQLHVTKATKCYFVGFISATLPLTIFVVERDEPFINEMIPKLVSFYKKCILPEIILRRVNKKAKCIELS